jgi:hypothetical protein
VSWEAATLAAQLDALDCSGECPTSMVSAEDIDIHSFHGPCPCVDDAAASTPTVTSWAAGRKANVRQDGARSLLEHWFGTYKILVHWGVGRPVAAAGLLHSAYGTDALDELLSPLVGFDEREKIQELVGVPAELLIFLTCTVDRRQLWLQIAEGATTTECRSLTACNRFTGERIALSGQALAAMAALEMANLHEQLGYDKPVSYLWLLSRMAARCVGPVAAIPVFEKCSQIVQQEDEEEACRLLSSTDAAADPGRLVKLLGCVPTPHVLLAHQLKSQGRLDESREAARRAIDLLSIWAVPWDKRHTWTSLYADAKSLCEGSH